MELWPQWIQEINTSENPIKIEQPLVELATNEEEVISLSKLVLNRKDLGIELLDIRSHEWIQRSFQKKILKGVISHNDGRIDPIQLQICLRKALTKEKVEKINQNVELIEKGTSLIEKRWKVYLANGEKLELDSIIICAATQSNKLIKKLGHDRPSQPILGQAISIKLEENENYFHDWPPIVICNQINLIPFKLNEMIMGASLETSPIPNSEYLKQIQSISGYASEVIAKASIQSQWYGLRSRPIDRPAPLLEVIEPGLILATNHYRNGILLAPATADWVKNQIAQEDNILTQDIY